MRGHRVAKSESKELFSRKIRRARKASRAKEGLDIMAQSLFESPGRAASPCYRGSAASYANLPPYKYISLLRSLGA
ncbi:hypothetical protein KQX54_021372 [Cotesia glomerata]|uniref:Uncharacterized protein n=1 Tax=Cotesia glomerata TaxID=32391 RepID=A0AAV7J8X2_COTGL|nr:hypothetical protein KQX54_021372 [Cotesia glomerata]